MSIFLTLTNANSECADVIVAEINAGNYEESENWLYRMTLPIIYLLVCLGCPLCSVILQAFFL
jgi:hypothetical protein